MSKTMKLTLRLNGGLREHVAANIGEYGAYPHASEYVCALIRRDKDRADAEAFARLTAELKRTFASDDNTYRPLDANTVIERNDHRRKRR